MGIADCRDRLHKMVFRCGMNQRYHQIMVRWWAFADKTSKVLVAVVAIAALVLTFGHEWKLTEQVVAAIAAAPAVFSMSFRSASGWWDIGCVAD